MAHPLVRFEQVWKTYGSGEARVDALAGVDLTIERGEFVAIMGPSGSGKSTAMNIIGYLDTPTGGEYLFDWRNASLQFITLGALVPDWARARYPNIPSIGRFESERFQPGKWVPEYPNPAFLNALPDDDFWMAKQIMALDVMGTLHNHFNNTFSKAIEDRIFIHFERFE